MNSMVNPSDQTTERMNPQFLVLREDVEKVLKIDKGQTAEFLSFEIRDFINNGVATVIVFYRMLDETDIVAYVVKLNPYRLENFDKTIRETFYNELQFYSEFLPLINEELKRAGETKLRVPECFYFNAANGREVIYLENLRSKNFVVADSKKEFDADHTHMILGEIARLHGASILLMVRWGFPKVESRQALERRVRSLSNFHNYSEHMYLERGAKIADCSQGYTNVATYLRSLKGNSAATLGNMLQSSGKLTVMHHGNLLPDKLLFRYDTEGNLQDCRLLGHEVFGVGSPALDLHSILHGCLTSRVRKTNMALFFASYYSTFASVLAGAGVLIPFTQAAIYKEFRNKNSLGLIKSLEQILRPLVLAEAEHDYLMRSCVKEEIEEKRNEMTTKFIEVVRKVTPPLLELFDEMKEAGVISGQG